MGITAYYSRVKFRCGAMEAHEVLGVARTQAGKTSLDFREPTMKSVGGKADSWEILVGFSARDDDQEPERFIKQLNVYFPDIRFVEEYAGEDHD